MQKSTLALGAAVVAIVIAIIGLYLVLTMQGVAGGITTGSAFPHGISVGNPPTLGINPTNFSKLLGSQTSFRGMDVSQAATSTKSYDLAITGIVAADKVIAMLSTTTPAGSAQTNIGWGIRSCHASTTPNFATCDVMNLTGAAAVPSASAVGSSTTYIVFGTQ